MGLEGGSRLVDELIRMSPARMIVAVASGSAFAERTAARSSASLDTVYSSADACDPRENAKAEVHTPARSALRLSKILLLILVATDLTPYPYTRSRKLWDSMDTTTGCRGKTSALLKKT